MTEVLKIEPETQKKLMEMQGMQQTMQNINMQKETLSFQKIEAEKAIEELNKIDDKTEVFKAIGPILVKTKKSEMLKDLKEKLEIADVRLKTIEKQEEKIRERAKIIEEELEKMFKEKK